MSWLMISFSTRIAGVSLRKEHPPPLDDLVHPRLAAGGQAAGFELQHQLVGVLADHAVRGGGARLFADFRVADVARAAFDRVRDRPGGSSRGTWSGGCA